MQKHFVNYQRYFLTASAAGLALFGVVASVQARQTGGFGTLNGLVPAKNKIMPMPSAPSVALHGTITSDAAVIRDKAPVRFTYKVTNTSKSIRYASVPAGGPFTITVKARRPKMPDVTIWTVSNSPQQAGQGRLTFAPGETKTFTAEWMPNSGTAKSYKNFVVEARLAGEITKQRAANVPTAKHGPPAFATSLLKGA